MDRHEDSFAEIAEQDSPLASITLRELAVVGSGGSVGVGLRYLASQHFPSVLMSHGTMGFVSPLLFINTLGAFLLGLLVPLFASRPRHHLRLLVTTGVLGGFTSYSALADLTRQQILEHVGSGQVLLSLGASLFLGLGAVFLGHVLGERLTAEELS